MEKKLEHHKQQEVCYTRPGYREARWERAVKVRGCARRLAIGLICKRKSLLSQSMEWPSFLSVLFLFVYTQTHTRMNERCFHHKCLFHTSYQVYTINLESRYLLVQNVPALGVVKEVLELFSLYGDIEEYVCWQLL